MSRSRFNILYKGEMIFSQNTGIMLYVDDVAVERDFWAVFGFEIVIHSGILGFETFEIRHYTYFYCLC